jgi:hypothetical protein
MGSHDVHNEHRRHTVYLCDICGIAYENFAAAVDCENGHEAQ